MARRRRANFQFKIQVFGILLTAFLLTIFELLFFRLTIAPTIEEGLDENYKELNKTFDFLQNDELSNFLNISSEEEKQLIEKLNSSVVLDGGYIVVVIGALLFYIMYKLKGRHLLKSPSIYLFSGGSFLLFISFQIYFFFVNQNYTYPTLEETFFEIKKELLANLNN